AVVAVAESLGPEMLSRAGVSKPILRDLAGRFVESRVIAAPKMGFPTPNRHWLEVGLKREVGELRRLAGEGTAGWWLKPRIASVSIDDDVEAWWTAMGLATTFEILGLGQIGSTDDN